MEKFSKKFNIPIPDGLPPCSLKEIYQLPHKGKGKEMEDEDEATTKRKSTQLPKMDWLIDQGIINIGDEVYLINHPEEVATVVDSKNVEYKGEKMSFNQYGCELTGWKAIQIYAFMKKVGGDKTLSKLREEKMKELGMLD